MVNNLGAVSLVAGIHVDLRPSLSLARSDYGPETALLFAMPTLTFGQDD